MCYFRRIGKVTLKVVREEKKKVLQYKRWTETLEVWVLMPRSATDFLCAGACPLPLGSCLPSACHFVSSGGIKGLLAWSQQHANAVTQALDESRRAPCQVTG